MSRTTTAAATTTETRPVRQGPVGMLRRVLSTAASWTRQGPRSLPTATLPHAAVSLPASCSSSQGPYSFASAALQQHAQAAKGPGRGHNGPATRKKWTPLQRYQLVNQAIDFMRVPPISLLDVHEHKVQAAAKLVGLGKSKGVNPSNLRNWLRPHTLSDLRTKCFNDPGVLGLHGKHKGGRGKLRAGTLHGLDTGRVAAFPRLEEELDKQIEDVRRDRVKVSAGEVRKWMLALVGLEMDAQRACGAIDPKLKDFACSKRWLERFFQRKGWTRRRATNKRSHGVEDLLGDVLGFIRFLRQLRRDNPSGDDPVHGKFGRRHTFNVDSVPMSFFDTSRTTVERKGAVRVSIIIPGSGLDKRTATLHLCIRPFGEQPYPTLILRGSTTEDGGIDTKKRKEEMEKYRRYKVHIIWQGKAWLDGEVAAYHWAPCFKKDLERLGLSEEEVLMMADNLDAQKGEEYLKAMREMLCTCVFGPKNGTDVWQPVDHGMGQRYQALVAQYSIEWSKENECRELFRLKKGPSAPRVRELLVQWTHRAYEKLEAHREEKEAAREPSLFELAFLRVGALVSINGDSIDKEMNPEGSEQAIAKSKDDYYKEHDIKTFYDLLQCSDGCNHAPPAPPPAEPTTGEQEMDAIVVATRFAELTQSKDPRAVFISKCLQEGRLKWAGSSLVVFLRNGVSGLLEFLSEAGEAKGEAKLLHDVDLYRTTEDTQNIGIRFAGGKKKWTMTTKTKRSVDKITLTWVGEGYDGVGLEVDQVNLHKNSSTMSPSTDIWGNLCAELKEGKLQTGQLVTGSSIPLSVTVHNVLRLGMNPPPPCYVLRRAAWPTYDEHGNFEPAEYYCDGRFRRKLHDRDEAGLTSLRKAWVPGPVVPPPSTFAAPERISCAPEEAEGEDEAPEEVEDEGEEDAPEEDEGEDDEGDPGDYDEVDVNDASLEYAKALQKEMDALPVWGVYESESSSRSSRTSSDRSARLSKRRRTT